MAGEWLIRQINKRGGNTSEYADLQFGTVLDPKNLKVQLSNQLILTAPFLIVGKSVTNHEVTITEDGKDKKVTIKNELNTGDKVAMIRLDGGQQFYILEKL